MRGVWAMAAWLVVSAATAQDAISVSLRHRTAGEKDGEYVVAVRKEAWAPKKTAVIVCDMWDRHHCPSAEKRVGELAPRMNALLGALRKQGVFVIHAPSSCMTPYQDHPARKRAQTAPAAAKLPVDIAKWCYKIPAEEKGKYPIDQTDGGCDCAADEIKAHEAAMAREGRNPKAPWKRQIDLLTIRDEDAISDSGVEIWNLLTDRGIDQVLLVGVHTNMCVLGRPFGLRQMAKNGKNVALVRDMTDTMYNPARWPNVSHFEGTDRIVEHIEKFVCPTVTSDQFIGGVAFRFAGDVRK